MSRFRLLLLCVLFALPAAIVAIQPAPPADLLDALRLGGYVIVLRHGATSTDAGKDGMSNPNRNGAGERQLSDAGRAQAIAIGEGLRPTSASLPADLAANTVELEVASFDPDRLRRHFYTSSSCGVCGKGALEAVAVEAPRVESELRVSVSVVAQLPQTLRSAQAAFAATGGLHATGPFTADGELLCLREDVGRHNAMDKVVGWAFGEGRLPLDDAILCVSGRLSFELVQKAAVAGCPLLVAVGAPSSLAVELASDRGVTLCGFVRDGRMNVYTEPWRIAE